MGDKPLNRDAISSSVDELHHASLMVDSREIFMHAHIGEDADDNGVDYRMAVKFVKNIRFLEHLNDKPIIIHQHSVGGDWNAGMVMYDAIKACELYVIFITHGIAASMGSVIPQSADLRLTMPNCDWLVHEGSTDINPWLTYKQSKSWRRWEDRISEVMLDIYSDRCFDSPKFQGKTKVNIRRAIKRHLDKKEDWWLSGKEAVEYGFVDGIYGSDKYKNMSTLKEFGYK